MISDDINNLNSYSQDIRDAVEQANHSVNRKRKERKVRKQRKRQGRFKSFLRFILLILLVYLMYVIINLRGWYLPQDSFSKPNTQIIHILNNRLVPTDIIYKQIKDVKISDYPIFMMSVKPVKKELYKIPAFKEIYVRRYAFPARIDIIVRERVPAAVLKTDLKAKPSAFVTTDGVFIVNDIYMNSAETDTTIKILATNPKNDNDWSVKRLDYIEKIVRGIEAYSSEKVHYIDMRNQNDVYVRIDSTTIRLGLLDSTVLDRIKRIYTILPQIGEVEGTIKYVDLSWDKVNYLKMQKNENKQKDEKIKNNEF